MISEGFFVEYARSHLIGTDTKEETW